jgi:transposase-like protein
MEERLRFVAQVLDGQSMTGACRRFGISRKTGYNLQQLPGSGLEALSDRLAPAGTPTSYRRRWRA